MLYYLFFLFLILFVHKLKYDIFNILFWSKLFFKEQFYMKNIIMVFRSNFALKNLISYCICVYFIFYDL